MYRLYVSNTCPKGVAAASYLQKISMPFIEVNLDLDVNQQQVDILWQLLRNWREDPRTPLVMPVLTQVESQQEDIVLVGYDPQQWSEAFQSGKKV